MRIDELMPDLYYLVMISIFWRGRETHEISLRYALSNAKLQKKLQVMS